MSEITKQAALRQKYFLPFRLSANRWRDSKALIDNMYVEFDRLITGANNSRNCTAVGVLKMMGMTMTCGYDRSSRFWHDPYHGTLLVHLLFN